MKAPPWRRKGDGSSSRPTVYRRTPVADARIRLFLDPESHTPTHLLAAGPTVRAVAASEGTAFDVYEAIAHAEPVAGLKGTYTIEWDDRGAAVRAEAVLELRPVLDGEDLMVLRLTSQALEVQRRRYVRVSLRCPVELFRPGTLQAFSEGWTTDLSEGGVRCQINGSMPGVGVPVIVQVTLPEHKSQLLIAGHVRRSDPDSRSLLVEFPPEHALADTIRRVVFALQQKRAHLS
jgi:PilZ domain